MSRPNQEAAEQGRVCSGLLGFGLVGVGYCCGCWGCGGWKVGRRHLAWPVLRVVCVDRWMGISNEFLIALCDLDRGLSEKHQMSLGPPTRRCIERFGAFSARA